MALLVCFDPGPRYRPSYLLIYPDGGRSYTSARKWASRFSKGTIEEAKKLVRLDNPRYPAKVKKDRGRQQRVFQYQSDTHE